MPGVKSRNSDATWLLLTLTLQLSRVVKDQLGLRIADRNSEVEGRNLRGPETVSLVKTWMCLHHMSADYWGMFIAASSVLAKSCKQPKVEQVSRQSL